MATRAYNKTLVLDASFTLIKSSTDSRLGQLDTSANSFTSRLGTHDTSIAKLDASATSFTTRLGNHDLILDKLDASGTNYKARIDKLDASATSFTTRLGNHDLILDKLDASGTNYKARIDKLDASANTYTTRLAVLDGSFNSLTLQSLFNNSTWDEDVSGAIVKLDVSSTYIINNFYDKHATEQLLDGSLNSLKSLYIDPSVNTLKSYTDLSLNELKSFIQGHYYTSTRTDASFANVLVVSSHTTSLNKLDASAASFTTRLGQLDSSMNTANSAILSLNGQVVSLQTTVNGGWSLYNPTLTTTGTGQVTPTADVSGGWYKVTGKIVKAHANFTINNDINVDGSGIYNISLPSGYPLLGQFGYINSTVIIKGNDSNTYTGVTGTVLNDNTNVSVIIGSSPAILLTNEHASMGAGTEIYVSVEYQIV